ncbi:WhiB family transcriptional regulator [Amycolatopsis sp. NPDC054798]
MTTTLVNLLVEPALDTTWMLNGACADSDPDLHFPVGEGPANAAQIAEAKAVCARCPVLEKCREYGMTQPYGIWGGLTETERRDSRKQVARHAAELRRLAQPEPPKPLEIGAVVLQLPNSRPVAARARRLFREIVDSLREAGAVAVSTSDIPKQFIRTIRSPQWVLAELQRLADEEGVLARTATPGVFVWPVADVESERRSA